MNFLRMLMAPAAISLGIFGRAFADDSASQPTSAKISEWRTYGLFRLDVADLRLDEKLIGAEVASQTGLLDYNLTGKRELIEGLRFQLDVDAFARRSWNFKRRDPLSRDVLTSQGDSSDNPAFRIALNEIYINGEVSNGNQFTIGKKRVLWGTGFAANPTDLINPAKNPLDPTYERRGAWLVQGEHIQESQTFALLLAPMVLEDKNTLPTDVISFRDADGVRRSHYLGGGRWYRLIGGADLNLMAFYSERFKEDGTGKWKGGASWSQILESVSKQLEGHAEMLVQRGSSRPSVSGQSRLDSNDLYYKLLAGLRYDFENESSLTVEVLHQSEGDSIGDLQSRLQRQLEVLARNPALAAASSPALATVQMKNTLYLNWQRYKFNDDLFLSWAVAHNLQDYSGYQGPLLQWTPTQSSSITLAANTDYTLINDSGVQLPKVGRRRLSELNPVKSRFAVEMKSFF